MFIFVFIAIFIVVIVEILLINKKVDAKHAASTPPYNSIDSQNIEHLPPEEQAQIQKVATFCGSRYITQNDIKKYTIHIISDDFAAMPGWNIWDSSIHEAPGQFERMERALNKKIDILSYDPKYQLAKIRGNTGIYLTSCKRCSCPDYHNRHLPCKHMYALAIELGGNVEKYIIDSENKPLYGLKIALAGKFTGRKDDPNGIRSKINMRGGVWEDSISLSTPILVCGDAPSEIKVSFAKNNNIDILSEEAILTIFGSKHETPG